MKRPINYGNIPISAWVTIKRPDGTSVMRSLIMNNDASDEFIRGELFKVVDYAIKDYKKK